jgi:hypothetical protein
MKSLLSIILLLIVITVKAQPTFNFKKDMVWIENAKLYVCKYEVTNIEYREFTDELLRDSLSTINKQVVFDEYYSDTTVWIVQFNHQMGDPMNKIYRWHPGFNGHPAVGVRYEGALKYCEWLTKKYGDGKYKFRLPTKSEFIKYARVNPFQLAGGLENQRSGKGEYLLNYKPNKTNLDDSLSKVFYNLKNDTFIRIDNDLTKNDKVKCEDKEIKNYASYVENYLNGYLYLLFGNGPVKYKIQDSITFYNCETNSYKKEKLVLKTEPNYYEDGFMYTSPSREYKGSNDFTAFDENGNIKSDYHPVLIRNKSSYPPDKNGLYDLAGNVSELVVEKGYSMGGNWNSTANECNYDSEFLYGSQFGYNDTDVLIGFRVVAEPLK